MRQIVSFSRLNIYYVSYEMFYNSGEVFFFLFYIGTKILLIQRIKFGYLDRAMILINKKRIKQTKNQ